MTARTFGPTRLVRAASLCRPDRDVYLKLETELPTGSFKVRGALHSLSVNLAKGPIAEVVAASTGNHGAAVAYAGRLLGIPARIFLPANPNAVKTGRIRELGATLVESGVPRHPIPRLGLRAHRHPDLSARAGQRCAQRLEGRSSERCRRSPGDVDRARLT